MHPFSRPLRIGHAPNPVHRQISDQPGDRRMDTRPMLQKGLMLALGALSTLGTLPAAIASNHSDAPLIKQDPQANLTDVYAFIGTQHGNPSIKVLNVSMSFRPFSEPGDGAQYERFADDARYSIHVTNPRTGVTRLRYDFFFSRVDANYKNRNTIISYGLGTDVGPIVTVGDARQNFTQSYSVVRVSPSGTKKIGQGLLVPPPNVGNNVTPAYNDANGKAVSGALTEGDLDSYTSSTIYDLPTGESVWAGPRDDSFFSDIPGVFDLLNVRILDNNGSLADVLGHDGGGVDGFKGFNLLSAAIQIPLTEIESLGIPASYDTVFFGQQTGVGVYASVSRPRVMVRGSDGSRINAGGWTQVSRLGNPL